MDNELIEKLWRKNSANAADMLADYAANEHSRQLALEVRELAAMHARELTKNATAWMDVYWRAMLVAAREGDFDSYMLYLERKRPAAERFYAPRRDQLREAVRCIQQLLDDELDELFLSMPPRVGKTTLLLFLVTYVVGLKPEASNLYTAFSDGITSAFYAGVMEILKDPATYTWGEIFPKSGLAYTNAKDETLDIGRTKRYHSFTARSLYGTLNGACDCNGLLMADDLIGGIEEALNPERLASAWTKVDNNYLPRAKMQAKRLWVGTRWATKDPTGVRMSMLEDDERFKRVRWHAINLPALNESGESNFNYKYGVGYDTEYYKQRMASFEYNNDEASWLAQYQGEPVDRVGTLFQQQDLLTYNGVLPDGEPDGVLLACDVAWGGGDFLCSMVGALYGEDIFIPSIVFDKSDKNVTRPKVTAQIVSNRVRRAQFEKNNGGDEYREWIETHLWEKYNYSLSITSKPAPSTRAKSERILERAPEIKRFHFLEPSKRDSDYRMFMANLLSYKIEGKNKNDDAPDCAAQLASMAKATSYPSVRVMRRTF